MDLPCRPALLLLPLPALAAACLESNLEPVNPRTLDPPAVYRIWWQDVEACTGRTAAFDRVAWYRADRLVNTERETEHVGAWVPPHTIYVLSKRLLDVRAVKHEMVHEMLQRRDHRSSAFTRCVVSSTPFSESRASHRD